MPDLRFSLPPVPPPSAAVVAAAAAILDAEGPYHVGGRYIADALLAERERTRAAERQVAAAEREARWLAAHRCPWCGRPVVPSSPYEVIGGEPLHARPCLTELAAAEAEDAAARAAAGWIPGYGHAPARFQEAA